MIENGKDAVLKYLYFENRKLAGLKLIYLYDQALNLEVLKLYLYFH